MSPVADNQAVVPDRELMKRGTPASQNRRASDARCAAGRHVAR